MKRAWLQNIRHSIPKWWKTAWLNDRSGTLYFTALCSLTGLFLLALLFS